MFLIGSIIAYRCKMKQTTNSKPATTMFYIAMIIWLFSTSFSASVNRLLDAILCGLLLYSMYRREFECTKKLKAISFFDKMGKISYEFFVYHLCILASFSCWIFVLLYDALGYYMSLLITYILTFALVFMLSCVSNYITSKYYNPIIKKLV